MTDKIRHPGYVYMAQQLGINILSADAPKLVRFAEEVAIRATMAEREACAQISRQTASPGTDNYDNGYNRAAIDIEAAILSRNQQ